MVADVVEMGFEFEAKLVFFTGSTLFSTFGLVDFLPISIDANFCQKRIIYKISRSFENVSNAILLCYPCFSHRRIYHHSFEDVLQVEFYARIACCIEGTCGENCAARSQDEFYHEME